LKVTRPALRYLGGKFRMAPAIIELLPAHRCYVEPYGGAMSVLLRKPKSYAEVYNDLDGEVVNLFRVLRDAGQAAELVRLVKLTPFAREEFEAAYEVAEDPIERARRLIVRSFLGHGSNATNINRTTGFRVNSSRSGTTPSGDWAAYPRALEAVGARIREGGVAIEQRPALDVIAQHDGPGTLFFCDPPYPHSTRSGKTIGGAIYTAYVHEMTDEDHLELLTVLHGVEGMVVISGYHCPLYDDALAGWRTVEIKAQADGGRERTEVLWFNPAAQDSHGMFLPHEVEAA
jgi:DNA adenine methylase